jgi:XTP/dITP diphosphohydrolase
MTIYLASGNAHKVEELRALAAAGGVKWDIRSARDLGGMPAVAEDTGTFEGNARKKARALRERAASGSDAWVLADDSGLCVAELGGEPGVESAYYAGPQGDGIANRLKLLATLQGVPAGRRQACFLCHLLLIDPDGRERSFTGRCDGTIAAAATGTGGFGYDPIFVPEGENRTMAEMTAAEKNAISHRARAFRGLVGALAG